MYWFNLTFIALVSALLSAARWWDKYSKKNQSDVHFQPHTGDDCMVLCYF